MTTKHVARSAPHPLVSAVVCTRDRAGPLGGTLESLAAQTLAPAELEVVVVDDGSTDATREVVRAFEARLPIRYAFQRAAGVASARNHGLFLARGAILVFVDDGRAAPALLEEHLEAHRRHPDPAVAVLGTERLDPSVAGDPLTAFALDAGASPLASWREGEGGALDFRDFRAGRASCKRALLLERGIFDASFRECGEDVELGYRLARRGLELVAAPRAEIFLSRSESLDELCARLEREGAARAAIARRHPDDPAAQALAALAGAEGGAHETILRSARELDRLARARLGAGLPFEGHDRALLHRSYLAAFRASRARGIAAVV